MQTTIIGGGKAVAIEKDGDKLFCHTTHRNTAYTACIGPDDVTLMTARLGLGSGHVGGCRVFANVAALAAKCKVFADLPSVLESFAQ